MLVSITSRYIDTMTT